MSSSTIDETTATRHQRAFATRLGRELVTARSLQLGTGRALVHDDAVLKIRAAVHSSVHRCVLQPFHPQVRDDEGCTGVE